MSAESETGGPVAADSTEKFLGLRKMVEDELFSGRGAILRVYCTYKSDAIDAPELADHIARVLYWRETPISIGGSGYVWYVDHTGSDKRIVAAARTTSQKRGSTPDDDIKLLRYLIRHRHTTPIEFGQLTVKIRAPMDVIRQHIRHRMSSTSEYSTRYSNAIDDAYVTPLGGWRTQATSNRQGSAGAISEQWPEGWSIDERGTVHGPDGYTVAAAEDISTPEKLLSMEERWLQRQAREVYERRLALGVAREQARKDLPLSTYTEMYWTIDLHNLLHYLGLRLHSHAQLEIRQLAAGLARLVEEFFPESWAAFQDYQQKAVALTATDQAVLLYYIQNHPQDLYRPVNEIWQTATAVVPALVGDNGKRERNETLAKLKALGFFQEQE